jgi:tetratricopeptide (TPR) repeat protein
LTGGGGLRAVSPQTAIGAWRRAGGSDDRDLTEDEARAVATSVAAQQVIQGSVIGSPNNIVLSASLHDAVTGDLLGQASVTGLQDSVVVLMSRLAAQLLAVRSGEDNRRIARLAEVPLAAVKAYLDGQVAFRGGRFGEALEHFARALQVDSTFALAGLGHAFAANWVGGASPLRGTRIAWENRDQFSERDSLLFAAFAPGYPGVVNRAEQIRVRERVAVQLRDSPEAWYLFGDRIYHYGRLLGMDQFLDRASAAFNRALDLNPSFGPIITHRLDQAIRLRDTTGIRATLDSFPNIVDANPDRLIALGELLEEADLVERWKQRLPDMNFPDVVASKWYAGAVSRFEDAEFASDIAHRRATTAGERRAAMSSQLAFDLFRGRPRAAADVAATLSAELSGPARRPWARGRINDALFSIGDSMLAMEALEYLIPFVDAPPPADSAGRLGHAIEACTVALWRLREGNVREAEQLSAVIEGADNRIKTMDVVLCELELRAMLATGDGKRRAIEVLDSLSRSGPVVSNARARRLNMILARLLEEQGEPERALAALRRRVFNLGEPYMLTLLREEGRLAALTGDREGAIAAYDEYLLWRSDPEPSLQAEVDRIRAELSRLVGETGRN